jgi:hypothetical protein
MHLFSAGTTFNDVRIPFPHVRVTGLAARSTLDNLQREHPTATPIIVGGDGNSLHLLFDEDWRSHPKSSKGSSNDLCRAMDGFFT